MAKRSDQRSLFDWKPEAPPPSPTEETAEAIAAGPIKVVEAVESVAAVESIVRVESIPSNLVARAFGFRAAAFFELDPVTASAVRTAPQVRN